MIYYASVDSEITKGIRITIGEPYGLDTQSIALFSASGTDKLYSGVSIRMTSAPLIFDLTSFTFVGISLPRSW